MAKENSNLKKFLKILLIVFLCIIAIAAVYVGYVLIDYHRVPDNENAFFRGGADDGLYMEKSTEYSLISYNVGFAAYTPDFGFFMDGGKESRAFSKDSVIKTMDGITGFLKEQDADFYMIEEVDVDATRSYHVDEREIILSAMDGYDSAFSINYDSPYLFYPLLKPHGKSLAGLLTLSKFSLADSTRRSLPIEEGFMKFLDLDRCYTVSRIPVKGEGGDNTLVLFTIHLSAYTSDGKIATEQLKMLIEDMQREYNNGNYVICGGDFNKDLLGDSSAIFGISGEEYTWAQPFPDGLLDSANLSLIAPCDETDPVPSCRNADGPYSEDQFVLTVDGFIVSDNVTVSKSSVIDLGFSYSDHNPVKLTFILNS